jgi:hypothetical protein
MSLAIRALASVATLAFAGVAVAGIVAPQADLQLPEFSEARTPSSSPLPVSDATVAAQILGRSPFSPSRAAFSRNAAPEAPPAPIEVKLAGIYKIGKQMRANLVIGGQSVTVKQGDDTPIGKVTNVEAAAVVIEGNPPRRIEMFKQ